ncbi:MAG: ComF family protein [Defluviitaleaceae bacterium]|nr:ComF family protein [Defluviitaleaceae bacterium]
MEFLTKKNKLDTLIQGIYRAIYPNKCLFCGRAMDGVLEFICVHCASTHGTAAPFDYNDTTKIPIHKLKYEGIKSLAAPMSRAICANELPAADFLLPVPLHKNRLKARGFNQATLIALEMSKILNLPVIDGLTRTRDTAPQFTLTPAQREKNLENAISTKDGFKPGNCRILLVDDIITTGSTANECTRILMEKGAICANLAVFSRAKADFEN